MPRRPQGPRLHWRKLPGGKGVYEIRDTDNGRVRISTGTERREEAESALQDYLDRKKRNSGPTRAEELTIGQVLEIYAEEHGPHTADPARIAYAIDALVPFWGGIFVSEVKGALCRRYANQRVHKRTGKKASDGTVRRELGTLQAALKHAAKEGHLIGEAPSVTLPPKPDSKERWLTRQEAAWLLRAARHLNSDGRHLADFIVCGLYTGSRKATMLALHIDTPSISGGHVDTVNGLLYRKPQGKVMTKKQQGVARLPTPYLSKLRRQAKSGRRYVVERTIIVKGEKTRTQVADIRKGWARAVELAEKLAAKKEIKLNLSDVTPHTLKHTAITWALQSGADFWSAAGYFSTSVETLQEVYGHHHPDWQESAREAAGRKGKKA
ncbi:tyrosine-type recombinase/integrase [Salipiger pacificus]|nr:tyrosine-type recombinase/integrase [Alloyangia pacifica]